MAADDSPGSPSSDQSPNDDQSKSTHTVPGWGWFLVALFIITVFVLGSWFAWERVRRRQLGPTTRNYPARGGIIGWIQSKIRTRGYRQAGALRNRNASTSGNLDDDVWNTRLGNEADDFGPSHYDEEVGLHSNLEPYSGGGYGHVEHGYGPREGLGEISGNKSSQQELDDRYDDETHGRNPFDERQGAERSNLTDSYRTLDPMPHDDEQHHAPGSSTRRPGDSPTERRSMFKEAV